jgi:uncharacterized protein
MRLRRRVGWTLLAVSTVLTVWSLSQRPATSPATGAPAAPEPRAAAAACAPDAPTGARPVSLPIDRPGTFALLEGELVCFTHDLIVTEVYELGRYGDLLLADRRLFGDNTGLEVDDPALHVIRLSSGPRPEHAWPLPWGLDVGDVRVGDAVVGLIGKVTSSPRGGHAVVPRGEPRFETRNPRPTAPPAVGGELRIAAFNLDNYFVTVGERGARDASERRRQEEKLVAALSRLDADVIALSEVEHDDGTALRTLVTALNDAAEASRRYEPVPTPAAGAGRDRVRLAFLVDPARVEVVAVHADTASVHDRAPQGLTLRERASGSVLSLITVHHKSKGGCPARGDVDLGFGCWNQRRTAQSEATLRFAARVAEAAGAPEVLVLGDLNAHRFEPPITRFETGDEPWEVLTDRVEPERAYSYVFFGLSAALDHAIASPALAGGITSVAYWAINADEPPVAGYRPGPHQAEAYRADPYRSSDHDPLVVGIALAAPASPGGVDEADQGGVVEPPRLAGVDVATGGDVAEAAAAGAGHLAAEYLEVPPRP